MQNNGGNAELIRDLLNGDCGELHRKFGLFLDQCPSFLHSANKPGFFPAFFFGMFATAFDSGVADADNERIYFRFDNYGNRIGNLKVAVLTNNMDEEGRRIVRCYTVADNENSPGSRFSEEETQWIEENQLQNLQEDEDLAWEEYKIFQRGEECRFFHEVDGFPQRDEPDDPIFHEINPTRGQGELLNLAEALVSNNANIVDQNIREILEYILDIYDTNHQELNFDMESDYHGFLSGFLVNFRYRVMADIYLELLMGRGYTDITLLVRGQEGLNNSVPIIIELKAGQEHTGQALEQARGYVSNCPISSVSIHTSSRDAVCVGLNFDQRHRQRLRSNVEHFLEREPSLVERLFHPIVRGVRDIEESVENYLGYPTFGAPRVSRAGIFPYTSRFAFASTAFERGTVQVGRDLVRVTKHLFNYHDNDRMLGQQGQRATRINVRMHALTMILFALSIRALVVLDIRRVSPYHQFPVAALDLSRPNWRNAEVREVVCRLEKINDELQINAVLTPFQSPNHYLRNQNNVRFQGNLSRVGGVGRVHRAANVMMNTGWQNVNRHRELFREISNVLSPLLEQNALITSEAEFQAVLHGLFYTLSNPARVIIEFQLQRGLRIDLVLSRSVERGDTHPIGIELKFANNAREERQGRRDANEQLQGYTQCGGCQRITGGNRMFLLYAVLNILNRGENLISVGGDRTTPDLRQFYR